MIYSFSPIVLLLIYLDSISLVVILAMVRFLKKSQADFSFTIISLDFGWKNVVGKCYLKLFKGINRLTDRIGTI